MLNLYKMKNVLIFIFILLIVSGCASYQKIDSEISARKNVEKYIQVNNIDISKHEFAFAKKYIIDKKSSLPSNFGPDVWIVRYGLKLKPEEIKILGGGILFYIDSKTGNTILAREID